MPDKQKRQKPIESFRLAGIEYGERQFKFESVGLACIRKALSLYLTKGKPDSIAGSNPQSQGISRAERTGGKPGGGSDPAVSGYTGECTGEDESLARHPQTNSEGGAV